MSDLNKLFVLTPAEHLMLLTLARERVESPLLDDFTVCARRAARRCGVDEIRVFDLHKGYGRTYRDLYTELSDKAEAEAFDADWTNEAMGV